MLRNSAEQTLLSIFLPFFSVQRTIRIIQRRPDKIGVNVIATTRTTFGFRFRPNRYRTPRPWYRSTNQRGRRPGRVLFPKTRDNESDGDIVRNVFILKRPNGLNEQKCGRTRAPISFLFLPSDVIQTNDSTDCARNTRKDDIWLLVNKRKLKT